MERPLSLVSVGAFPFPAPYGSPVFAKGLAQALAGRGHRSAVLSFGYGEGAWPQDLERVPTPRWPGRVRSGPGRDRATRDGLLTGSLTRWLRSEPVDAVLAHHVEGLWAGLVARRLAGVAVPVVYIQHTRLGVELVDWFPALGRLGGLAGRGIDRLALGAPDAVVVLSEEELPEARSRTGRPTVAIPPGLDLRDLEGADADAGRERYGLGDRPWVGYLGNTDRYQDLPDLLRAMAFVPEAGLLGLVTDGADGLRDEAVRLGLSAERLRIIGERDFRAARDGLAACVVAAVPRRACPGFPMKVLNALGLGVPVVACVGGAPDLPGVVRVPPGDPRRLGEALGRWISDPEAARAAGGLGQGKLRGEWSWARRAFQWEQVLTGFRPEPAPG